MHPVIAALFSAQSVKGNGMACMRCEKKTSMTNNDAVLFFVTEIWICAQRDEAKTVELAPSGLDV